jgi:heptosyltransferase-1
VSLESVSLEPASSEAGRIDIAPATIRRLLVVRLSAMGDVIHTLPAVSALRKAFPRSHIGWLIEERWAELLCTPRAARHGQRSSLRPLVDEVHAVDLKGWGKSLFSLSTPQRIAKIWNDVRDVRYDIVVDLQGAIRSAVLARWSRARMVYGSAEPRESPASLWYTRKVQAQGRHVVEQNLSIAEAMIESQNHGLRQVRLVPEDISFQIPRDPQVEASVGQRLERHSIGDFAILNPGAGWGAKRWPAERYGEVARALSDCGVRSILNYGPGEEELARAAESASRGTAEVTSCSLTELIALTRRARIFIGGDTGPLHLASALRVPVVAIYGPTDPARNGPYGTHNIVLRSSQSLTTYTLVEAASRLLRGGPRG